MDLNLNGKRALVCGASKGIGRAAAHELALLGADVILLARNEEALLREIVALPNSGAQRHSFILVDMLATEALREAVEAESADNLIQILVNNTGGPAAGPVTQADLSAFEQAFRLHLLANQVLATRLLPGMRTSGYGRIINVISTSVKQPIPGLGVSNTIRGAVANWSKTLAREVAPDGITVNNVLPGATSTDRLHEIIANKAAKSGAETDAVQDQMKSTIPMGRFGRPEELGQVIAFLASPAASYITGTNVVVDGGRTACL